MSYRKDASRLARDCNKLEGVVASIGGNGHWKVYKDGVLVSTFAATPSDWRWEMNARRDLKLGGVMLSASPPRKDAGGQPPPALPFLPTATTPEPTPARVQNRQSFNTGGELYEQAVIDVAYLAEFFGLKYKVVDQPETMEAAIELVKQKKLPRGIHDALVLVFREFKTKNPDRSASSIISALREIREPSYPTVRKHFKDLAEIAERMRKVEASAQREFETPPEPEPWLPPLPEDDDNFASGPTAIDPFEELEKFADEVPKWKLDAIFAVALSMHNGRLDREEAYEATRGIIGS